MRVKQRQTIVAAAGVAFMCSIAGCGWIEKTVECRKLSAVSNRWSESADAFGNELEADLKKDLNRLQNFDTNSKDGFRRASSSSCSALRRRSWRRNAESKTRRRTKRS